MKRWFQHTNDDIYYKDCHNRSELEGFLGTHILNFAARNLTLTINDITFNKDVNPVYHEQTCVQC